MHVKSVESSNVLPWVCNKLQQSRRNELQSYLTAPSVTNNYKKNDFSSKLSQNALVKNNALVGCLSSILCGFENLSGAFTTLEPLERPSLIARLEENKAESEGGGEGSRSGSTCQLKRARSRKSERRDMSQRRPPATVLLSLLLTEGQLGNTLSFRSFCSRSFSLCLGKRIALGGSG
ncbi:hypothetical protein TNCV_4426971 [Trichonephila clavipes]|nr:hypothetical protein TNCV_4426971 [Trichonephila clavipes]